MPKIPDVDSGEQVAMRVRNFCRDAISSGAIQELRRDTGLEPREAAECIFETAIELDQLILDVFKRKGDE